MKKADLGIAAYLLCAVIFFIIPMCPAQSLEPRFILRTRPGRRHWQMS